MGTESNTSSADESINAPAVTDQEICHLFYDLGQGVMLLPEDAKGDITPALNKLKVDKLTIGKRVYWYYEDDAKFANFSSGPEALLPTRLASSSPQSRHCLLSTKLTERGHAQGL